MFDTDIIVAVAEEIVAKLVTTFLKNGDTVNRDTIPLKVWDILKCPKDLNSF